MASARRTQRPRAPASDDATSGTDLPMTVPEVAVLLRKTPKAIYSMIGRGQLPGIIRIGRRLLVDRQILVDWLRQKATVLPERESR
jgi:excisionase family DNA binding protein